MLSLHSHLIQSHVTAEKVYNNLSVPKHTISLTTCIFYTLTCIVMLMIDPKDGFPEEGMGNLKN